MPMRTTTWALVVGGLAGAGCSGSATREPLGSTRAALAPAAVSASDIATIALANVGKQACDTNSAGGTAYESSCTGNGGEPEYWCADFAMWVWQQAGADVKGLDAAAGSFYVYGQNNGTLHDTPAVGDAVVFDYQGGGVADHVAVVTQVNANGTIESVSGDWNGTGSTEAGFSSTSSVVLNSPAYDSTEGQAPSIMGMTISGYVSPVGLATAATYGATYVSQSFPLATTALTMKAGETLPSFIEMKNTGTATWDSSTRLGTTQPRDRVSVFADATWLATDRPAGVTGTVAPGATFKFAFDLHAPSKAGTYYEYFNLVQENVAWFGDPGQGGPADDDLEVQVVVVAGEEGDAGAGTGSGSGSVAAPVFGDAGDGVASDPSASSGNAAAGGCAVSARSQGASTIGWLIGLAFVGAARRRRRA